MCKGSNHFCVDKTCSNHALLVLCKNYKYAIKTITIRSLDWSIYKYIVILVTFHNYVLSILLYKFVLHVTWVMHFKSNFIAAVRTDACKHYMKLIEKINILRNNQLLKQPGKWPAKCFATIFASESGKDKAEEIGDA